ncbi:MAG: DUF937 domain-containing protein [Burkholderiales bacterium]
MTINLLEMLKSSIAPEIVKQASTYLGESEVGVRAAVDSILPTLIGGLMQKGATQDGANKLLALINSGPSIDTSMLSNLSGLFSGGERTGTLLGIGGTLLRSVFEDKADGVNAALSGMNNMKAGSGGSLMAMVTPLLFGILKNHVAGAKMDELGLMKLLSAQRDFIAPVLSDKTTYAMGLGSVATFLGGGAGVGAMSARKPADSVSHGASGTAGAPMTANAPAASEVAVNAMNAMNTARSVDYGEEAESGGWWKKLIPIAALALAGVVAFNYFVKGKQPEEQAATEKSVSAPTAAPTPAKVALPEPPKAPVEQAKTVADAAKPTAEGTKEIPAPASSGAATATANGMKSFTLPGGGKLEVPANSIGEKLIAAMTTPGANLKKTFNLDKLLFNSESADLGAEGRQQLQEVASVLKAFPTVQIRLNGHADNSGDKAGNKVLSGNRAAVVKEALVKLGIAADRITTDSFGASQPVASNANEAGRQQNRRVEVAIVRR